MILVSNAATHSAAHSPVAAAASTVTGVSMLHKDESKKQTACKGR
jgi:hypothetical protein